MEINAYPTVYSVSVSSCMELYSSYSKLDSKVHKDKFTNNEETSQLVGNTIEIYMVNQTNC